ncbi:hypothetical protein DQ384_05495 [Sphaerisporangium album]|uniref:Phage tail protein n=1 Tax=Sphaerisporangium album TaxID=509200 RepID=A0A367FQK7_9ACTN|nr:hypothetical protein [Sphaerisporangium album]RCG31997.1 hypothetical protein DQ384_05495 [Sphaerisporangium album]
MARLGRGIPVRQVVRRPPLVSYDAEAALPPFETPFRYPRDQQFTSGPFVTPFIYPPMQVSAPHIPGSLITRDGEIEWNGMLWSPSNQYRPSPKLTGWDSIKLSNGNVERGSRHGAWPGRKLAGQRIVNATVQLNDDSPTFQDSLDAMINSWAPPDGAEEYPLAIRTRGKVLIAFGAIIQADAPPDLFGIGVSNILIQWACSDPRRFGTDFNAVRLDLAGGTLTNPGNAPASPRFRFHGPVTTPRIQLADRILAFNVAIGTGERLDVDTANGDLGVYNTPGTVQLADYVRLDAFSVPVERLTLPGGTWPIQYIPDAGGAGGFDVFWRSTWW